MQLSLALGALAALVAVASPARADPSPRDAVASRFAGDAEAARLALGLFDADVAAHEQPSLLGPVAEGRGRCGYARRGALATPRPGSRVAPLRARRRFAAGTASPKRP